MKTSSSKAKGHLLEALVRDKLIERFGLSREQIRIPIGSEKGSDIKLTKSAQLAVPLKIECKSRKSFSLYSYWDQANAHEGDLEPVVIIKANRRRPLICLDLDYFLGLL